MTRALTRDDVVSTVEGALQAEYGGYQYPAAARVVRALEDEGAFDQDGTGYDPHRTEGD